LACAAVPITDPATGRILGAVGLACRAEAASPLMVPFVKRARWEIEHRLIEGVSVADRVLLEAFLRARRRAKGPLISVSDRTMQTNAAAAALVEPSDQGMLWEWATRAVAGSGPARSGLRLSGGLTFTVRATPVEDGGVLVGVLLRLDPAPPGGTPARRPGHRTGFGWPSLTGTERSVAGIIAEGATNRQAAARLFVSPHTIDFHLRQIFRKLGIASRVQLTRLVIQHAAADPRSQQPAESR
jgi:DNA-binding CsgD family transcriptional regulator